MSSLFSINKTATRWVGFALLAGALTPSVFGLNVVLTNDDGFETNNIQALFSALKAAGHDVIMSAPYGNQSGTSGQVAFLTPVMPTSKASAYGRLPAGSPGAGATTMGADQYYVDGSPVAAVLRGIDVLAKAKWGRGPDLVISGPNTGNNLGFVTDHSGTVGAAVTALNKGIPAIAVSARNDDAAAAPVVAQLTLQVLNATLKDGKVALPAYTGLNVNVPEVTAGKTAASFQFAFTQIGHSADFGLQFFDKLGDSPVAVGYGIPAGTPLPGVSLGIPYTTAGYPVDPAADSETRVLAGGTAVTVSPIQGTYQATADKSAAVLAQMKGIFAVVPNVQNPQLLNTSARGMVGAGAHGAQIMGLVIAGEQPKTMLIRAAGPALAAFGINDFLADPRLTVYDRNQNVIASNDDWSAVAATGNAIAATATRSGAWAWIQGSKDAALIVTLAPGVYTAVVTGAGNTSGVTLIESYDALQN